MIWAYISFWWFESISRHQASLAQDSWCRDSRIGTGN